MSSCRKQHFEPVFYFAFHKDFLWEELALMRSFPGKDSGEIILDNVSMIIGNDSIIYIEHGYLGEPRKIYLYPSKFKNLEDVGFVDQEQWDSILSLDTTFAWFGTMKQLKGRDSIRFSFEDFEKEKWSTTHKGLVTEWYPGCGRLKLPLWSENTTRFVRRGFGPLGAIQHVISFPDQYFEYMNNPMGEPEIILRGRKLYLLEVPMVEIRECNWNGNSLDLVVKMGEEQYRSDHNELVYFMAYHHLTLEGDKLLHYIFEDYSEVDRILSREEWIPQALLMVISLDGSRCLDLKYLGNECSGYTYRNTVAVF